MHNDKARASEAQSIIYDFDPYNLPPKYLEAIGLVITTASQVENILQMFIGSLLGIDNAQSAALCTQMSFPLKENIIRTLSELEAPNIKELDKIDALLDAAGDAIEKRNKIAHACFSIHPTTKQIFMHRIKARSSLQLEKVLISAEDINQYANAIHKSGLDILNFMISRKITPINREKPLNKSAKRGKKAREERLKE